MRTEQILDAVKRAGVVGQGGAGFPTHVKLDATVETVIANGCECEPLLATDVYIMTRKTDALLSGLALAMRATGASQGVIALKGKHGELISLLREKLAGTPFDLLLLPNFYPAGDEQVLVHEATGRSVPPLGLPRDAGCLVSNVGTLVAVAEAVSGTPVTRRTLTVTGEVARPGVFTTPIGTSIAECIEHVGGSRVPNPVVILGGPVMGKVLNTPEAVAAAVVTKTLNGVIVLPQGHYLQRTLRPETMRRRAAAACIQCRYCSDRCPRFLIGHPFETHRVMRAFAAGLEMEAEAARQALLCCGCGVCEHVACPMELSPCSINTYLKQRFAAEKIRYAGPTALREDALDWNAVRKTPLPRLAARIGIEQYMDIHPEPAPDLEPDHVIIPLHQHIGAPAVPVCAPGDTVRTGDILGLPPENALGAAVHASLVGVVTRSDAAVHIRRTRV